MREVKSDLENWEKGLGKKRKIEGHMLFYKNKEKKRWYQEKSIFCTEGRHSFYIARKILLLVICMLCLVPGKVSLAGQMQQENSGENLNVIIRDKKFRKVLVKKGCAYKTDSSILLEIPWEEVEGENCKILVECEDKSREKKQFMIECVYSKK